MKNNTMDMTWKTTPQKEEEKILPYQVADWISVDKNQQHAFTCWKDDHMDVMAWFNRSESTREQYLEYRKDKSEETIMVQLCGEGIETGTYSIPLSLIHKYIRLKGDGLNNNFHDFYVRYLDMKSWTS